VFGLIAGAVMIVEDGLQTTDLLIGVVDNLANELLADNPKVISG